MDGNTQSVVKFWESLTEDRLDFMNTWQEVADYSVGRNDFVTERRQGQVRTVRHYDSTAADANELLGAAMHSMTANPLLEWHEPQFVNDWANEDGAGQDWLHAIHQMGNRAFENPQGGFTTQAAEVFDDLPAFGNACMYIEDDPGLGPRYVTIPLRECAIEVDQYKRVNAFFRHFPLRAYNAASRYGVENMPQVAKALASDPGKKFNFLHYVRKAGNHLPGEIDAKVQRPWEHMTIALDDRHAVVAQGSYYEMPYAYARWKVDSGESYGRGPGVRSLPEAKMLHAMWRTYIRSVEKACDPPVLVDHDGVMPGAHIAVTPNAQIVVNSDGSNREPVRYLESRAQFGVTDKMIENRSTKLQKAWHSEVIQAFLDPRMTATQVVEMMRLSQKILSPVMARVQVDFLEPVLVRTYGILSRRSDFPQKPEHLKNEPIKIEYISPVARAQRQGEAQAILDTFAAGTAIAELDPSVIDNIDLDKAFRAIAHGNSIPSGLMRSNEEVIEIRASREEQEAEQKKLEMMEGGGELLSKMLPGMAAMKNAGAQ